ncbi:MAG: hypothetical protein JNJ60_08765 [Rhodocyclaceae bacterium]|nr:hypothetical protein [Rhodocyclaceae bacterium]
MTAENCANDPPSDKQNADAEPALPQAAEAQSGSPKAQNPRRRLRELLAIAERDRSDAVWDEIIELEIQLAAGNRVQPEQAEPVRRPDAPRRQEPGRRPEQQNRQEAGAGSKPNRRNVKKPKRSGPATPKK